MQMRIKKKKKSKNLKLVLSPFYKHSISPDMKECKLTDLVFSFHGEFHQQLLGISADEDEWRRRLLAGFGELQGGRQERCISPILHKTRTHK